MADYWKSLPRHFCKFCKCWTADNKPSRDFHERGKRHQENVEKKIDELRKKGLNDYKKEKEMSSYLKHMEKAAMAKLKDDLKSDPLLASQYGVVLKTKRKMESDAVLSEDNSSSKSAAATTSAAAAAAAAAAASGEPSSDGDWVEATNDEGYVYYWNSVTMESRWEPPLENTLTNCLAVAMAADEPGRHEPKSESNTPSVSASVAKLPACKKKKKFSTKNRDAPAAFDDVSVKFAASEPRPVGAAATAVQSDTGSIPLPGPPTTPGAGNTVCQGAYGAWKEVKLEEKPLVDLQLPTDTRTNLEEKTLVISNEQKMKFREKTVASLAANSISATNTVAAGSSVSFRKPKSKIQRSIRSTDVSEDT